LEVSLSRVDNIRPASLETRRLLMEDKTDRQRYRDVG
jgi:hypothetical protein